MSTAFVMMWFIYLLSATVVFGLLGMGLDIWTLHSDKKTINFQAVLTNYINIVLDIIVRFLSIPVAFILISWLEVIIPTGNMHNIDGFMSFILKLAAIVAVILITLKIKIPFIGKVNSVERASTRSAAGLGSIVATVYFFYLNFHELRTVVNLFAKKLGIPVHI
jgi:hypothetical protein